MFVRRNLVVNLMYLTHVNDTLLLSLGCTKFLDSLGYYMISSESPEGAEIAVKICEAIRDSGKCKNIIIDRPTKLARSGTRRTHATAYLLYNYAKVGNFIRDFQSNINTYIQNFDEN